MGRGGRKYNPLKIKAGRKNLRKHRHNAEGTTKPFELIVGHIRSLKFNPLWLHLERCVRCENQASYLFRNHVYLCHKCWDKLKFARLRLLVEYPVTAQELWELEKEKAKEEPSP